MKGKNMARLNSKKLFELKEQNYLTDEQISELTGIPIFTVTTLFSGRNHNPSLKTVIALMELFSCELQDLFIYEEDEDMNMSFPLIIADIL